MDECVPKAENDILAIIRRLEDEISQRKEALVHLHKAAELIGLKIVDAEKSQDVLSEPSSVTNFQIPVSARVDEFIDQLEPEQIFSTEDVVKFVGESGLDTTERLRANISSALSRRKGKGIIGITRGQFKKFITVTTPSDAISYIRKPTGDATGYSSVLSSLVREQMAQEKERSHE